MNYQQIWRKPINFIKLFSWYQILSILVFTYPLFNQKLQVILFGIWVVGSIYYTYSYKTYLQFNLNKIKVLLSLSIIYILYIIEFVFSSSKEVLGSYLEKSSLLLILPLLFILNFKAINKKVINSMMWVYVLSISLLNLIILLKIINQGFFELLDKDSFYHPVFRTLYAKESGFHLPYLGMMFQFASLLVIYQLLTKRKIISNVVISLLLIDLLLLNFSSFLFSARMALAASFIIFVYLVFKVEKSRKNKIIYASFGIVLAIILSLMPPIQRRISEVFNTKWEIPDKSYVGNNKEVNFRYVVYNCSYEILKDNWLLGVGIGNVQFLLNECYKSIEYTGYDDFNERKYNSHNQYLEYFMAYGVIGLAVFLFFILNGWRRADVLYQCFIILMVFCFLTENILYRQAGILFFVLFNTIFYLNGLNLTTQKKTID